MATFKVNDLVRIVKQTSSINAHIPSIGLKGFIEEIVGDIAQFVELREDGLGGSGGIPLDCLQLANDDAALITLKQNRDAKMAQLIEAYKHRAEKVRKLKREYILKACDATGVSYRSVSTIFEIAQEFEKESEYI